MFDQAFIVSGGSGGPNYSTVTVVLYLYQTAIKDVNFGYAAAIGIGPVRAHLRADADPAAPLRQGRDRLMATETVSLERSTVVPRGRRAPCASAVSSSTRSCSRLALLYFTPFLWTVSTSLKTLPETVGFDLLPDNPSLRAYREVLTEFNFAALRRSTLPSSPGRSPSPMSSSARSAATRSPACASRAGRSCSSLVLATLMIPDQLRLVPVFQMLTQLAPGRHVPGATSRSSSCWRRTSSSCVSTS